MAEQAREPRVIAGYDGSESARTAVTWAAREAASRGLGLTVVQVVDWPVSDSPPPAVRLMPPAGTLLDDDTLRNQAERQVAEVTDEARQTWPELVVGGVVEFGRAAETLVRMVGEEDLVVIGSSGRTALPRMLLGSTAAELVHTCQRPVVVVRNAKDPSDIAGQVAGRVVVGVDGSSTSERAIGFAFDFAARHGHELVAVYAWSNLPLEAMEPMGVWDQDPAEVGKEAEILLAESLAGFQERFPEVSVRREVLFDRPAHALVAQADGAALLVVGSHGRGAVRSVIVGSVSHAVIYHAPCPVAVVRGG